MGAALFLVVVVGVLLCFAPRDKNSEANYGLLALLSVGLISGASAATYYACGTNNEKRAQRDEAFERLCQRHQGLVCARRTEFVEARGGEVPWIHSEEWSHCYGMALGEHQGEQIIALECTHIIDPILTATDSEWLQGLAGIASKKHQRLHLRAMDAVLFVEPLDNVTDLIFFPQDDPGRAYYKRDLRQQQCELAASLRLPRSLRKKYWLAAALPEECEALLETDLPTLLESRKWCIVQVVGGHCVVITSRWHGNRPGAAPNSEEAIERDLEFAHAVYQELKKFSAAVRESRPSDEPAALIQAEATRTTAGRSLDTSRRRPHSRLQKLLLFGLGAPLLCGGALITWGVATHLHRGRDAANWPWADGHVRESVLRERSRKRGEQVATSFKPLVRYEYEVDGQPFIAERIQYGAFGRTDDKQEAERVLSKDPPGAAVRVFYRPGHADDAVLEPGVGDEPHMVRILYTCGGLTILGMLLVGYGFAGKRSSAS